MSFLNRFFTFSSLIWLLAAVAVFILIGLPSVQDAWAYYFWERVPCKVDNTEGRFRFVYKYQETYYSRNDGISTVEEQGFKVWDLCKPLSRPAPLIGYVTCSREILTRRS